MTELIEFTDGRRLEKPDWRINPRTAGPWPEDRTDRIVALDEEGHPIGVNVWDSGYVNLWGMTWCCGASFTGTDEGIACRGCYALYDEPWDTPWGNLTWRVGYTPPSFRQNRLKRVEEWATHSILTMRHAPRKLDGADLAAVMEYATALVDASLDATALAAGLPIDIDPEAIRRLAAPRPHEGHA